MVDPGKMCNQHLLGEHVEIHMLAGTLRKKNIRGFLEKRLLEPSSIVSRHDSLVEEMLKRGYSHNSPIGESVDLDYLGDMASTMIDSEKSALELASRCKKCAILLNI